jgi:hypothetical protein
MGPARCEALPLSPNQACACPDGIAAGGGPTSPLARPTAHATHAAAVSTRPRRRKIARVVGRRPGHEAAARGAELDREHPPLRGIAADRQRRPSGGLGVVEAPTPRPSRGLDGCRPPGQAGRVEPPPASARRCSDPTGGAASARARPSRRTSATGDLSARRHGRPAGRRPPPSRSPTRRRRGTPQASQGTRRLPPRRTPRGTAVARLSGGRQGAWTAAASAPTAGRTRRRCLIGPQPIRFQCGRMLDTCPTRANGSSRSAAHRARISGWSSTRAVGPTCRGPGRSRRGWARPARRLLDPDRADRGCRSRPLAMLRLSTSPSLTGPPPIVSSRAPHDNLTSYDAAYVALAAALIRHPDQP